MKTQVVSRQQSENVKTTQDQIGSQLLNLDFVNYNSYGTSSMVSADESAIVQDIDQSFQSLIQEDTYPWLISKFIQCDKKVMMPCFKRKEPKRKRCKNQYILEKQKDDDFQR